MLIFYVSMGKNTDLEIKNPGFLNILKHLTSLLSYQPSNACIATTSKTSYVQ